MSSIVIKGNTSGQVEIAAPDVAGSTTLTLPTGNGTVITTNNIDSNPPASLSTASGSAPSYSARAWVNFNGTGVVAIRASGNVTSITDNGTGNYTVNFTTTMVDANYSVTSMAGGTNSVGWSRLNDTPTQTTSAFGLFVANAGGTALIDAAYVNVHFIR